ncbi:hypothetical protein ACIBCA_00360 [Kitasatospora sp. NPDC051170]|uniref:hypothetical protein n=1 Tax=Kitasatospora sp. NPDC051170 TaxID=3364056 RepID=UPI003791A012
MAISTTTPGRGRRRAAVALAGLVAFTGLGLATATTASAQVSAPDSSAPNSSAPNSSAPGGSAQLLETKCYIWLQVNGAWKRYQVRCAPVPPLAA